MKKTLVLILALVLVFSLFGCAEKETVRYYETRSYTKSNTGDINRRENTYDENWNLLLQYRTLNDKFASQVEYEYSEDYTVLTTKTTSAIYEPETSRIIRTFNEKGQIIRSESYDDDRLVGISEITYDENGEKVFIKSTHPESNTVTTLQRVFDDRGNLVRYIQDTGYYVSRYEYTYDKKDRRIREDYYWNDELRSYIDFIWEGNVSTGTSYDADGTPGGMQILEYDDAGNLLRQEALDLRGTRLSYSCYEYVGADGSISCGIPKQ
jgi:YD repeat-containing protein